MEMSQRFHIDHLEEVTQLALQGCRDIYKILDKAVKEHLLETGDFFPQLESNWAHLYSSVFRTYLNGSVASVLKSSFDNSHSLSSEK